MNFADYLLERGDDGKDAIVDPLSRVSYGRLREMAARMAGELLSRGLGAGDPVGILGQNSAFWVASYLAILKLGMVAVPMATLLTPEDASRNAEWVGLKAVCVDRRQARKYSGAFGPSVHRLTDEILGAPGPSAWPAAPASFEEGADAAYMFTSGTTSRPKAVRITHANLMANTDSIIEYLGLLPSDKMLVILPFFYCFGTSLLHTHLRAGGSLALCNSFTFPETALDLLEAEACTGFAGVPSSFQLLLRISTFGKRELPSLRLIQQAGGKLHGVLVKELAAAKPRAKLFVMYGQTEATARLSYLPPDRLADKLGSIGRGVPGVELSVVGEDGKPVKPGETGEIVARGRSISPGYYRDEAVTAEKFRGGALHTGDLATVDEEGFIFVVDRKEDFIKSWGYRVSSQEIESCVLELPEVVAAAAVGVPDLEAGEAITVFAVLRPDAGEGAPDRILEHCRSRLAKHMVPKALRVVPALPLNPAGKVLKSQLRSMAEEAR